MSDVSVIAVNLVVNPPDQEAGSFTISYIVAALELVTTAPEISESQFGSLAAVSIDISGEPVLGKPTLSPSAVPLFPISIAARSLKINRCLGIPVLRENLFASRQIFGDRHIRRLGDSYASAFSDLLPIGLAWPRHQGAVLMTFVSGFAQVWGRWVDRRAADLLEQETDPRLTLELLPDWERNWGLPDPCFAETFTIDDRRKQLVMLMTLLGGQSRDFFIFIAFHWLGQHILITEYAPFMCGISECGDTRDGQGDYRWQIGPPEMRFYWTVHIEDAKLTWFRASVGQSGVDPHLRIGLEEDLECLLRRWKPSHTEIVFNYSGFFRDIGSMAGTP